MRKMEKPLAGHIERIEPTDCKLTKRRVSYVFEELFEPVRELFNTDEFTVEGSVRCNTKVGDPDEVDIQIPLRIPSEDITLSRNGTYWTNEDCPCGEHDSDIPQGEGNNDSYIGKQCPYKNKKIVISRIKFGVYCIEIDKCSKPFKRLEHYGVIHHNNHLSPRAVKHFLMMQLGEAANIFNNHNEDGLTVKVKECVDGPAIQVTIVDPSVEYKISVDVVPTLVYPVDKLRSIDRTNIKETLRKLPRKDREEAGELLYLIPKFDDVWKLSFAQFENNILDSFYDEKYDCKKDCLRYLKNKLMKWKMDDPKEELKPFSSYMLKTLLFRALVQYDEKESWTRAHMINRVVNMLEDFAECVLHNNLPEFFNEDVNLLEKADYNHRSKIIALIRLELIELLVILACLQNLSNEDANNVVWKETNTVKKTASWHEFFLKIHKYTRVIRIVRGLTLALPYMSLPNSLSSVGIFLMGIDAIIELCHIATS